MDTQISEGKWRRLRSLADAEGRFKMMAIDQRGSLNDAIAKVTSRSPEQVAGEELAKAKEVITRVLAPYATAVLTDPIYGYPYSFQSIPRGIGLLLAHEETGYERSGPTGKERKTNLIEGWSVEKAQRAGADAVKLLLYYHPDASEEVRRHQQDLVQRLGQECEQACMPFLLELVSYAIEEGSTNTDEFARKKPDLVIRSAREFSAAKYKVDVLKLEFPADLKRTREFCGGAFDGQERQAVYQLSEVREFCRQLNEGAGMPWVILSAGVNIDEFLVQVELATEAGASGFLCGRAIWKDAVPLYPDVARMEEWLRSEGVYNFLRANAYAHRARPWFGHRRFREGVLAATSAGRA
ncbi:MAG: tagatose 1,6-diphosphate aldolase [Dehalococcoidia bacterium]|nr:tagatose 1,6-diphosphate aldolase [Dehalococcoidia bacterium]